MALPINIEDLLNTQKVESTRIELKAEWKPDERYMRRALQLAALGLGHASPNPMVGAVIVAQDGRIIGEGWHRRCGEGHAEVNAVASVADEAELRTATMYVTLEPCSHWGRTPPCAKLIIDKKIPRVVVAATDPFPAVSGRGIAMLREAGVDVTTGMLEEESLRLNRRFITAHTEHRPFIVLKWAQSADGFMDCRREPGETAARLSSPLTQLLMHRLRTCFDAILVGSGTALADDPRLDCRLWPGGEAPRPVVLDRRGRVPATARMLRRPRAIALRDYTDLPDAMHRLYEAGITSLMVEGGAEVLRSFVAAGMWDAARVETAPQAFGSAGIAPAPAMPCAPLDIAHIDGRIVTTYTRGLQLSGVKNI